MLLVMAPITILVEMYILTGISSHVPILRYGRQRWFDIQRRELHL